MRRRDLLALAAYTAGAWPLVARAQRKAMPVIGWLASPSAASYAPIVAVFKEGLSEAGYVEGKDVAIEYRWAEGHLDRLPALAADLVSRNVDVIETAGGIAPALAAKNATDTIPIVFETGTDPIAAGLVRSLARPGGNLTGISFLTIDLVPKQLELLLEFVPEAKNIALLVNAENPLIEHIVKEIEEAAHAKGARFSIFNVSAAAEFAAALESIAQLQARGLVVVPDTLFAIRHKELVALAAQHAIPAVYFLRQIALDGGLISYGADITSAYRQAGVYAGRILKGEKPADLPVQQPTKFELVINLKTAKALGLRVPQSLLAQADEVIE